jgi:hypothetical protein
LSLLRVVIHGPEKAEDLQKLLHEISKFRAEKTMKYLNEAGIPPTEITELVRRII